MDYEDSKKETPRSAVRRIEWKAVEERLQKQKPIHRVIESLSPRQLTVQWQHV